MEETFEIVYNSLVLDNDLATLDRPVLVTIKKAIESKLVTKPDLYGKPLRGPLRGYWSLRIGDYRAAYHIEKKTVYIDAIQHRASIYKTLSDRIQ